MSYLTLATGIPDFSKAVISLWFRVPRESVIAAADHSGIDVGNGFFQLQQILPLVTFGREQEGKVYGTPTRNVAVLHPNPNNPNEPDPSTRHDAIYYEERFSYRLDPCYIGVACFSDETMRIEFKIQTANFMSLAATSHIATRVDLYSGADPNAPFPVLGNGVVSFPPNVGPSTIQDVSYVDNALPEWFVVSGSGPILEPDKWHHLLLSFDIGGLIQIGTPFASSECRLWYAVDDVDYRGAENLLPYRDLSGQWGPDNLDPNAILTDTAWRWSGSDPDWEAIRYFYNHYVGLPSGSLVEASVPSNNAAIGIPSSLAYQDGIFRCEMAEFQMWTGVTLDTGITDNRRAFVGENGKPVDPAKGAAEQLLGKKPEILLHKSSNWKIGHNTGTIGVEEDSEGGTVDIPDGQFEPTAKIEQWKPDPSLEETATA